MPRSSRPYGSALPGFVFALGLFACDSSETISDLGVSRPDATTTDAGRADATPLDAGRDAGSPADEGVEPDAEPSDSGAEQDAGPGSDAEPNADAEPDVDTGPVDSGPTLPPCNIAFDATLPAQLRMTADDAWTTYLNGTLIVPRMVGWNLPTTTSIQIYQHPLRPNALAVDAENLQAINGFDRGVLAELTYTTSTAVTFGVVTSSTTRVATATVAGWTDAAFDDSAWPLVFVEGPHGMGPWGAVLGTSNAQWVWSYDSNVNATEKPVAEELFFRITFYVHRDGSIRSVPDQCAP